jgi:hypothetical protein
MVMGQDAKSSDFVVEEFTAEGFPFSTATFEFQRDQF